MAPDAPGRDGAGRPADELAAAVTERLAGSGYVVARTADGFVVHADVTRAHAGPRRERPVRSLVRHHVVLDEPHGVLTVTDERVDVTWRAGAPPGSDPVLGTGARVEHRRGRVRTVSFRRTWDPSRPRGRRVVDEQRFDSDEALRQIRAAATGLGWTERVGTAHRVGRVVGTVGAVAAGLTLAGLALALVLGRI